MKDHLQRVISTDGRFFGLACVTTDLVAEACRRHDTGPTAAVALGRALTANLLLAALLKGDQQVMMKFEGNGPLRKIVTEGFCTGEVRGYVANPHADVPLKNGIIDVATGLGEAGFLTVTKDIGVKNNYEGTVQLYTSEIGEDVAFYLAESEQIPSAISVGVQVDNTGTILSAGGFLVQSLPPADEELITSLETNVRKLGSVTNLIHQGKTPDYILEVLFGKIPHRTLLTQALRYQCSCSEMKMKQALFTLDKDDLIKLKKEKPDGVEVRCDFCANTYLFDGAALQTIIDSMEGTVQ
jgi:molecular chaperone Hsp33